MGALMSRVRRRLATTALVLAWLCANGALWDAMQVAAWGKMFAAYSESMSLPQALRETLDPSKPCAMCVGIAKAKDAAAKEVPGSDQSAAAKFVLALHVADAPVFANDRGRWVPSRLSEMPGRTDPVPVPPPRAGDATCVG